MLFTVGILINSNVHSFFSERFLANSCILVFLKILTCDELSRILLLSCCSVLRGGLHTGARVTNCLGFQN